MAVTEIAILHATANETTPELKAELADAQTVQDKWHAETFPASPSSPAARGTAMFQQVEDPAKILITARWDTVDAHWRWIASPENTAAMEGLASRVVLDEQHDGVLLHLEGEIFSAPTPPGFTALLSAPIVRIETFYVESERKDAFQGKFNEVKEILQNVVKPDLMRGSWRVDKANETKDEFLLFSGWPNMEQHEEFVLSTDFPRYRDLMDIATDWNTKHYRRFL